MRGGRSTQPIVARLLSLLLGVVAVGCSAGSTIPDDNAPTGPIAVPILSFSRPIACEDPTSDAECRRAFVRNTGDRAGAGICRLAAKGGSNATFLGDGRSVDLPELEPGETAPVGVVMIERSMYGEFPIPTAVCDPGYGYA